MNPGIPNKRWTLKTADEQSIQQLTEQLKIDPVLCKLLAQRGIHNYDEAKNFFRPQLDMLHDPFLMLNMDTAVERIQKAIENSEKILVYGDYDVDGTTSVALVYGFLKEFYPHMDYYIPDRYKEGYGISMQGVDFAAEHGFKLVIALDCGIKANKQVDYANTKGVDFIICDHHLPGDELPKAIAVLDQKQPGCEYPYKELSGCGIGFKLIQAIAGTMDIPVEKVEKHLELVAVSIASDIVPITGENRVLAYFGLKQLNENPRKGIKALMELAGMRAPLRIVDLVFMIGPRINAAGRMEDARKAVSLLLAEDESPAQQGANILQDRNTERKQLDREITAEALQMIADSPELLEKKTTVVFQPHWHKGVIGIVASRLIESHHRPTIVLTESQGQATGSARSVPGFDVYAAIKDCEEYLEQFGGHKYAAGLSLPLENLAAFTAKFEEVVAATITEEMLVPEIQIDAEIALENINQKFYNIVRQMEPFGPGNRRPVFVSRQVRDSGRSKLVKEEHLKLSVQQDSSRTYDGIAFGMGKLYEKVSTGNPFDICYVLEENEWKGLRSIQLNLKDLK